MSDVKLTRAGLLAVILRLEDDEFEHLAVAHDVCQAIRATRALLAVTEPASAEEQRLARLGERLPYGPHVCKAWRAAEARVRRLAGFGEEG
jgi:hypothetical protein